MLVEFICPEHGVVLATNPVSRVECHCGKEAAPEGVTPTQQKQKYLTARRVRRLRGSKRYRPRAKAQVRGSRVSRSAPLDGAGV